MSVNKCVFIGRVAKPEIRQGNNGEIATFSLAIDESYKKDGQKVEKTTWIPVVVYSKGLVSLIKNYVSKGSLLYVEGSWQNRKWTDKSGVERYNTDLVLQGYNGTIQMLGGKDSANNAHTQHSVDKGNAYQEPSQGVNPDIDDQDIPF